MRAGRATLQQPLDEALGNVGRLERAACRSLGNCTRSLDQVLAAAVAERNCDVHRVVVGRVELCPVLAQQLSAHSADGQPVRSHSLPFRKCVSLHATFSERPQSSGPLDTGVRCASHQVSTHTC
jgi:hypothetical protein